MADHPNVDLVRRGYDAFATGDMDTMTELFAEDVVWHLPGNNPLSGDYKGRDEVFSLFARTAQETAGSMKFELHDVVANDEHAVALVRASAERSGKRLDGEPQAHVFHVRDGKVTEFWGFGDTTKADEFWS